MFSVEGEHYSAGILMRFFPCDRCFRNKLLPSFFTADEIFLAGSKRRKKKNRNWTL